jgi:hypothetical protein
MNRKTFYLVINTLLLILFQQLFSTPREKIEPGQSGKFEHSFGSSKKKLVQKLL